MAVSFAQLQKNYPKESRPDLFRMLGGQWPTLLADRNYENTCAVRLFGKSTWGMSKNPGVAINAATLPKFSSIICYHANWNNASGHFDLWTGSQFVGSGNFGDIADGFGVVVWRVD
jgi:hypothetical protein